MCALQNTGGWTVLHEAAVNGQAEVIEQLVALGANLADRTKEGDTVLHKAARWGHAHVVELLLALGSDVNAADNVSQRSAGLSGCILLGSVPWARGS